MSDGTTKKPDVSNLKIFGCKAFVHIPCAKPKSKLDNKSITCIFVGYPNTENGFQLFNPEIRQMFRTHDVSKHKRDANGNIQRYKARLVAKGFSQKYGINYDEVFAPVTKYNSIRTELAIANDLDLEIHQIDLKNAFLNGDLDEEIYLQLPDGFVNKDHPESVCRLQKSLYRLKEAAQC